MANNTTTLLSNSIIAKYVAAYLEGAKFARVYDQMAAPIGADMSNLARGSSVTVPFLSRLAPSTQTISETADLSTSTFRDASVSVTPTSRANAVSVSELFDLQNFTGATNQMFKELGLNAMESIEQLAIAILWANGINRSITTRSSLDAGTSTHLLTMATFVDAGVLAAALKIPTFETGRGPRRMAIVHPYAYKDLFVASGAVANVGTYQDRGVLLNNELGELQGFSIVVSPWAKAMWGAGAANGTAVSTTVATTAIKALDTSFTVASASNISAGKTLTIGTVESSTTLVPETELVTVTNVASTTITIAGSGPNGGFQYDHAVSATVKNTDNVFLNVFGTADSIAKVYNTETGEFGKLIPPSREGIAEQFIQAAWKFYGNYGKVSDARFIRVETASSMDA